MSLLFIVFYSKLIEKKSCMYIYIYKVAKI